MFYKYVFDLTIYKNFYYKYKVMNEQEITEENVIINIQLGDFIELDAPSDPDIHNHTYYIKFLQTLGRPLVLANTGKLCSSKYILSIQVVHTLPSFSLIL